MSERRFPLLGGGDIPWSVAEAAYAVYGRLYGMSQSLERIAERGGFAPQELAMWLGEEWNVDLSHHRGVAEVSELVARLRSVPRPRASDLPLMREAADRIEAATNEADGLAAAFTEQHRSWEGVKAQRDEAIAHLEMVIRGTVNGRVIRDATTFLDRVKGEAK